MRSGKFERFSQFVLPCFVLAVASLISSGCGGGSGGNDYDDLIGSFNNRNIDLYSEVPPIFVTGNAGLMFYPKGSTEAGLYDSTGDLIPDTKINNFQSFANAANNIFREEIAACISFQANQLDHYDQDAIWLDNRQQNPDVMPEYADASGTPTTDGTQFVQIRLPFAINRDALFDTTVVGEDFLTDNIVIEDYSGTHVPCVVLLNGRDAFANDYTGDPNWPAGAVVSTSTIVIIAERGVDAVGVPGYTLPGVNVAFTGSIATPGRWDTTVTEFYVSLGTIADRKGNNVAINSRHAVVKSGIDVTSADSAVKVLDVVPFEYELHPVTGQPLVDHWPTVNGTTDDKFVPDDVNFMVTFNKPVVPISVGQSIVFNKAPFSGNMAPILNPESNKWIPDPACTQNFFQPICPNLSLRAFFIDSSGGTYTVETPIPCRIYPLHQNNLATYIVNPLIDIPGSSTDWSGDIQGDPASPPAGDIRMRLEVVVYEFLNNTLTGDPDGKLINSVLGPQNLCAAGFQGERFSNGTDVTKAFSVLKSKRYVNAPVAPNVMYYSMGNNGIGAIDLDGNGFTTNTPGTGRNMLVTSTNGYSSTGSCLMNNGNPQSYPVGLGLDTPIPGINEGSAGWWNDLDPRKDALVRDSYGNARLYPDATVGSAYINVSDMEVGDFLDTIYFDRASPWNTNQNRLDMLFTAATGSFKSNLISSPPSPNPPPLSIPVGMRPVEIIMDELSILEEGAFVIMGREVFPVDAGIAGGTGPRQWVHLEHGVYSSPPQYADKPLPPNPPGLQPFSPWAGSTYIQDGPLAETSTFGASVTFAARQQIGNFLFVSDKANNEVKVINSNNMTQITSLRGVRGPDHLAVTPDLQQLYVSNGAGRSVSIFDVNPSSPEFLNLRSTIQVGIQPKGLCAQPDYEDVLVCNYGSNSISIINPATGMVRKTLSALLRKPYDLVAGPRQQQFGWGTEVYHAYISNYGADNVVVYESGPSGLGGVGFDNILDPVPATGESGQIFQEILKPKGLCYDPGYLHNQTSSLNLTGGCFVAHTSAKGAAVSRIMFVDQQAPWGPIYLIPNSGSIGGTPGFGARRFLILAQWTAQDGYLSGFGQASDVAMPDLNHFSWINASFNTTGYVTNWGAVGSNPSFQLPVNNKHPIRFIGGAPSPCYLPDLIFVSYASSKTIDVIEFLTGDVTTITDLPAPATRLKTFFKN